MIIRKKIKVLIVDDSLVFRETLARGVALDNGIEVVATASDPYDARDKLIEYEPDVMILDVEMPKMNGIDFLRRLMPQYPIPTVIVSAAGQNVFEALKVGAVDFVTKPDLNNIKGLENLINELIVKTKIASVSKVGHWKCSTSQTVDNKSDVDSTGKIIAIGSSTGGTEAIFAILKKFPKNAPGIVIVQHMPPNFTRMYAERLNNSCLLEVREAKNGDKIYPGLALIAPGDYHMRVRKAGKLYTVECFKGEKVSGHCPSVDVLFESVANSAGPDAIGVILTGMGSDGAKGLLAMRQKGARTIGQNEQSCVVYGMPKAAYDIGAVEKQTSLGDIPHWVYKMLSRRLK